MVPYYPDDHPLEGLCDGAAWHFGTSDTHRVIYKDGVVAEEVVARRNNDPPALKYGLKIVIKLDW
jgi:hypothetical protein